MASRLAASAAAIIFAGFGSCAADAQASDPAPAPICTDRPTKANVPCTVPPGDIQIEADAINWTRNRDAGVRTDTLLYTNPTIKYGLGARTDVEVNIVPYETVRVHAGGGVARLDGLGDLYLRVKQQVTDGSGKVQLSLIPYVKAPTAKLGIGNDRWEGGVIAPIVFSLPAGISLNLGPELDVLADGDGHGHHVQLVSLANLSRSFGKATLYAEFWNAQNFDPAGTVHQFSADVAVTYLLAPTWQIDAGANFGLNRFTPDRQLYLGISTRF